MVLLRSFLKISVIRREFHQNLGRVILSIRRKTAVSIRTNHLFLFTVALYGLFSAYRVPDFIRLGFERSHVGIHLHFEFSLEITWHSPRVPAHRTSTILEFAPGENSCFFIHDPELRLGLPFSILDGVGNKSLVCDVVGYPESEVFG